MMMEPASADMAYATEEDLPGGQVPSLRDAAYELIKQRIIM